MPTPIRRFAGAARALAAIVAVLLALPALLAEQREADPAPGEGILVLRNGNLIRGRITQAADRYHVAVQSGEIHVKRSDVQFQCRTLEEAYQQKRSAVRPGNVGDRLELAQWCQRHGLPGAAVEELAEAKALHPEHPLIPLIERRISTSLWQPEATERPAPSVNVRPSSEELDQLVRGMLPGSVEAFTRTIQPLLVNRCSAAGCHGPDTESRFQLLRIPPGRPPGRRLTQRNLHSTLECIDHEDPAASPILGAPVRPHGSAKAAVFTDRQTDQYKQLVRWVYQVAREPAPEAPVPEEEGGQLPGQDKPTWFAMPAVYTAPLDPRRDDLPDGSPDAFPLGVPAWDGQLRPEQAAPDAGPSPGAPNSTVERGASPLQFAPLDPFDPEIFNRRFHSRAPR